MTDFRLSINGTLLKGAGSPDVINPTTGRALTAAASLSAVAAAAGCCSALLLSGCLPGLLCVTAAVCTRALSPHSTCRSNTFRTALSVAFRCIVAVWPCQGLPRSNRETQGALTNSGIPSINGREWIFASATV